uniref:Vps16 N-terminal domain-containing protein n=1 Tax=Ditylenchus dipsaci TaxID=166011 RepID=A0A915DFM1_9BILA
MTSLRTNNDWTILGDLFIRNVQLYQGLSLPIRESGCLFASCPYGGPIAIALAMQDGGQTGKSAATIWKVIICSSNGKHQFGCIQASAIVNMFWSKCQKLIIINCDARVLLYSSLGKKLHIFDMGKETQELGMIEAKCFSYAKDTGLAVLNSAHHIYAINSINNRALWRVHDSERQLVS